jgi:hypothetical protein
LKRLTPAALLAIAAAVVIMLDAVVVVVPHALADPKSTVQASMAEVAAGMASPSADPTMADIVYMPTPAPTPFAASTQTHKPTPKPTVKPKAKYQDTVANARLYVKSKIGLTQYNCIDPLFYHESRWNPRAKYPSTETPETAAYGIPQAHPGIKMAAFGSNWKTSPLTQVKWGIWYVNSRYGSACAAWAFKSQYGWY